MSAFLIRGDARRLPLADRSVQAIVTSPPYFNLRSYGQQLSTWGGREDCPHVFENDPAVRAQTGGTGPASVKQGTHKGNSGVGFIATTATCSLCGCWRGELGSEPDPQSFVAHLVEVMRECWRVLRDDGVAFVNIGDSMAGSGKGPTGHNGIGDQGQRQGFINSRSTRKRGGLQGGTTTVDQSLGAGCPTGTRPKSLLLVPERLAIALSDDGWIVRSRIAWCLSGGTMLYVRSQKGDMPMSVKDLARLKPGTVQLWNGEKWTNINAIWENQQPSDPLEIELRSGEKIGCTPEHRWPTQRGLLLTADLKVGDVLQSTRLPEPTLPRQPKALDDEDIGWFVGLYLAEGNVDNKAIHIASHARETDRYERCKRVAEAFDGTATWRLTRGNGATITIYGRILRAILEEYISGHGAKSKRLSNACWRRSNVFLRGLLEGYLHGDGYWEEKNQRWRLSFTRNNNLAADFRPLCARLGYYLRVRARFAQMNGRSLPSYRGEIRYTKRGHHAELPDTQIVGLGYSRGRKFWDIEVEDEPHLFALASGVLTHNCKAAPMPESVRDRPTSAWEHIWMLSKQAKYYWDAEAVREPNTAGTLARHGRGPEPPHHVDKMENEAAVVPGINRLHCGTLNVNGIHTNGANLRNFWLLSPDPYPGAHFATFPREIPRRCILAASREGDVVLDPFSGSGTTCYVAASLGRVGVGVELSEAYIRQAQSGRLAQGFLPLAPPAPPAPRQMLDEAAS